MLSINCYTTSQFCAAALISSFETLQIVGVAGGLARPNYLNNGKTKADSKGLETSFLPKIINLLECFWFQNPFLNLAVQYQTRLSFSHLSMRALAWTGFKASTSSRKFSKTKNVYCNRDCLWTNIRLTFGKWWSLFIVLHHFILLLRLCCEISVYVHGCQLCVNTMGICMIVNDVVHYIDIYVILNDVHHGVFPPTLHDSVLLSLQFHYPFPLHSS